MGLLLSPTNRAYDQNVTGALNGTIIDPNDAVSGGATVSATHRVTGAVRKMTANSEGFFAFESLLSGEYEVKGAAQGCTAQLQVLTVQIGVTVCGKFTLTVGEANQIVNVRQAGKPAAQKGIL